MEENSTSGATKDLKSEIKNETKKERPQRSWDLNKYVVIALVTFITFCCCILFFFLLYRYNGFASFYKKIMKVLQPVIIGLVVAYLLNPVMMFIEKWVLIGLEKTTLFQKSKNPEKSRRKMARSLGTAGALAFLLLIIFLLLEMVIPQLIVSIQNMVTSMPAEVANLENWVQKYLANDKQLQAQVTGILNSATAYMEDFLTTKVLPQAQTYIASITTGVISIVKVVFNFIIGLIISIYVLTSKESFIGQGKKVVYTIFPAKA